MEEPFGTTDSGREEGGIGVGTESLEVGGGLEKGEEIGGVGGRGGQKGLRVLEEFGEGVGVDVS